MKRFAQLALLLLSLVACGGRAGNNSGDGGLADLTGVSPFADLTPIVAGTPAEACAQLSEGLIDVIARCLGYDETYYRSLGILEQQCASQVASVEAGRQTYQPDQIAACLDLYATTSCSDFYTKNAGSQCQVFVPTVAPDGECHHFNDCAGGWCNTYTSGCPSTCRARVAVGAACNASIDQCAIGSLCLGDVCTSPAYATIGDPCGTNRRPCDFTSSWCGPQAVCVARPTSGACTSGECAYGYQCTGASGSRTCQRVRRLGEPCTLLNNDCFATEHLYCSAQTHTCSRRTLGQSCGELDGTGGEFASCDVAVSWCQIPPMKKVGTCVGYVADGAACISGGACRLESYCISGICRPTHCL